MFRSLALAFGGPRRLVAGRAAGRAGRAGRRARRADRAAARAGPRDAQGLVLRPATCRRPRAASFRAWWASRGRDAVRRGRPARRSWGGSRRRWPIGRTRRRPPFVRAACRRPADPARRAPRGAGGGVPRRRPPGDAATLPAAVAEALRGRGARRIVVPAGLPDAWLAAAIADGVALVTDDPPLTHAELDAIDGVVTGCAVAIAETGTVVLDAGPGQGRRALSLLPDRHVCVVEADRIVARRAVRSRAPGPTSAADLDQRAVGDQRHRAGPRRGCPRASGSST